MPLRPLRKFKFRVQLRSASSKKPRRVSLVAQRKIVSKGKVINAGAAIAVGKPGALNTVIAAPKVQAKGQKVQNGPSTNVKVGKKWRGNRG